MMPSGGKIICEEDLPKACVQVLGKNLRERLNTLIHDIVIHSMGKNDIMMSDETYEALQECASLCLPMSR